MERGRLRTRHPPRATPLVRLGRPAKWRRAADQPLADPLLGDGGRAAEERALVRGRRRAFTASRIRWGPNVADCTTPRSSRSPPTSWSVVFEEQTLPRRPVQRRARAGLRRADPRRRCGAVPDVPQARARHRLAVRSSTTSSTRRRSTLLRGGSARSRRATGTTPSSRWTNFKNEGVVAFRLPGRSR